MIKKYHTTMQSDLPVYNSFLSLIEEGGGASADMHLDPSLWLFSLGMLEYLWTQSKYI